MRATIKDVHDRCVEEGDCWLWQQSLNSRGYPQAHIGGGAPVMVRRLVLDLDGRTLPKRGMLATSKCGQRTCCSPVCLAWSTRSTVLSQSYRSGTRSRPAEYLGRIRRARDAGLTKLWWHDVATIHQRIAGGDTVLSIARDYGVHESTIHDIKHGRSWRAASPFAGLGMSTW